MFDDDKFKKPLRVAHIKSPFLPFSETFIYNYVSHLQRYTPIVITEYQINHNLFPVENIISHRSGNGRYEQGLAVFRSLLAGRIQRELFMGRFYKKALKESVADVVHIHFGVPGLMLRHITHRLKLPVLVSFYGYDLSQTPQLLGEDVYKRNGLFENGQIFTAEGNCARQRLIELGCPENKAYLLRIGIDLKKNTFKPRKLLGTHETPKILFCGRFVEKKGLLYAIRAVGKVKDSGHNFSFDILGDGPQRKAAEQLVSDLQLGSFVRFHGIVSYEEFIRHCYNCHVFLAPSVTAQVTRETEGGAPTVLLEAQSTGMPVVATYHADIPEVVLDGKSGFLVPERDTDLLAKAITTLLRHPEHWHEMGEHGRRHIEQQHDNQKVIQNLESLYDLARETQFHIK